MKNARDLRLQSDYEALSQLARGSGSSLQIESVEGRPPERYVLVYHVRSIERLEESRPVYSYLQRVSIRLPAKYPAPFAAPVVNMLTPVYHPHVYNNLAVCMGQWQTSEFLDHFAIRLGGLLQFEKDFFNIRDPANEKAVDWAKSNRHLFPTDVCKFYNDPPMSERVASPELSGFKPLSDLGRPIARRIEDLSEQEPISPAPLLASILWRDVE